ncbi:MAG TPA: glycosyltransferase family 2 protein [Verrucomicrobiota bacterium]|nr:glycosyltransferase family 2 protein [Verrucomicrobiota bacterium]
MPEPLPLSVAIVTLNEEADLPRCLESVRGLAKEIVVLDSGSTDRTAEIARNFGATFEMQPWAGFVAQKTAAFGFCKQPWVLNLDADEVVSPELADALRKLFSNGEPTTNGFEINRRTFYLGDWIWHAWNPDWVMRLVRRDGARWTGHDPHAHLAVTGATTRLSGDLLHYSYRDLEDHLTRTIHYARVGAARYETEGRAVRWYNLVFSPWAAFAKKVILKSAWRDGWRGWVIACATGFGVLAKYAFVLEKRMKRSASDKV